MKKKLPQESENSADERLRLDDPYVSINRECLEFAVNENASDIHIEPKEHSLDFRLRINGKMSKWKSVPKEHADAILWRAKWATGLDLSVVNQPQDGRATFNDLKVDVRINAVPTLYGPKLVMRLLPHNQNFNLENLKLKIELKSALMNAAGRNQGLIIISGPTGSGKTTTLYSLLNLIDSGQKNICTVENPIEYRLPGITQVDISEGGLSFAAAMRAMLRQDPDVILLGEIRDAETAKVAIHAAATGHLVLSTLHANSASEVPSRLNQLGIDPMSISSTLLLSFAQRLVPLLCPKCSKKCTGGRGVAYFKKPGDLRLINPDGCKHCSSGIIGRYPIAEIAGDGRMPKLHSEDYQFKSTQTLYEHACYLAEKGRIDYREALALI